MIDQLIIQCREAKRAYDEQYAKIYKDRVYNGRYWPKANRLHDAWQKLEKQLIREIYK